MDHEYEAQLEDLNKAIELDPTMAEAYFERGNLYSSNLPKERGGDQKAVADYTRCLELKPNDAPARWNRATYYASLRQYDEAIADWTIYIEGDTDFSQQMEGKTKSIAGAHFWRGHVYQMYLHDRGMHMTQPATMGSIFGYERRLPKNVAGTGTAFSR
jgi:tetratricopeptide (TPR) repeat protein